MVRLIPASLEAVKVWALHFLCLKFTEFLHQVPLITLHGSLDNRLSVRYNIYRKEDKLNSYSYYQYHPLNTTIPVLLLLLLCHALGNTALCKLQCNPLELV